MPGPAKESEAAAIRRHWITLGELLAVAAVIISSLTFWNSYSERRSAEAERAEERAERAAERQQERAKAQELTLRGTAQGGGLRLAPLDATQAIQGQTILFPPVLGRDAIKTVDPRIHSRWVQDAVKDLAKSGGAGDARLPVAITTRFLSDGASHSDTAIYDVGYRIDRGLLDTDTRLLGLAFIEHVPANKAASRLDAIWRSRQAR